ncbi:endonuclease/exonuclease/phosphatase family protein [Photobacterium sp. WH77]|uniref:Endonuclease/exonuclease/phosphatase family protein n=1 Tax=Photobacterium arenosum TaxID=2774143 RepID=A0ABR9BGK6_9GAMM|nr:MULTISPECIES: endonuclease/exonuclease/phosphatase family protein [Photobacterium]MBD8511683.1 endonuclease/exonuclease/phosphatase family protein [Photobacterium arenosum]MBV7261613.1 endonuclease/exonuclease/phosphatase family protein [Photobacterium sp. WH24]MCG2836757.1 endonuclease/exonuclease/phosphatase family protein [Photobacterium sp. WH77]MCG2844634.1 endonuclease/exonuclease/phosphatase family protein [Photobacterium sp. WH80]MDO6583534.1 endonuclease/exonuclease/phosphatase fam
MFRKLAIVVGLTLLVAGGGTYYSFDIPDQAQVTDAVQGKQYSIHCLDAKPKAAIDRNGMLQVTVWNIYKQQRDTWQTALETFSADSDLVLIQEAKLSESFRHYLAQSPWQVTMANAFAFLDTPAGVMNLSRHQAAQTCAYLAVEPWLRIPKSALLARFPLTNGQQLTVVNLHGINFAWGLDEYRAQFNALSEQLEQAKGPVLLAGDFNTWRQERMAVVTRFIEELGLHEVTLDKDLRTRVLGWPLDHLFYRGLKLEQAEAPGTDASDHHPIIARFRLLESKGAKQ